MSAVSPSAAPPPDGYSLVLHQRMIDRLVRDQYVRTSHVESAFRTVPRHPFLPGTPLEKVYSGEAIVTRLGPDGFPISSSSEPAIMAVMLEQLDVRPGDRVLEIGAGTGYNAALLASLTRPGGAVTTVDIDEDIVAEARANLQRAGISGLSAVTRDGWLGAPFTAPFDRIEATVGVWDLSPHWVEQLREDGLIVIPLWLRQGVQASIAFRRDGTRLRSRSVEMCGFMRLRGPHRGPENYARVGRWTVSVEEVRPDRLGVLEELLTTKPRVEAEPPRAPGWHTRLALGEPDAVFLTDSDDWRHSMGGILDMRERGLAVIERSYGIPGSARLVSYGSTLVLDRLKRFLSGSVPLDLRTLRIQAIPTRNTREIEDADGQHAWLVRRPSFVFALDEPLTVV